MQSAEINRRFLDFFTNRGHHLVASAPLIAADPTLLFVNAGMVPFKPYFLGESPAPFPRATSVQKCVRTADIEVIGTTSRHATFFQMAGNFSFGDYFKDRAIPLAWELLTGSLADGGFGLPADRMWVTVYQDDDQAADIWQRVVGLSQERVQRRGKADNFWSMGVPGPCGPCSEIYYDRGAQYGPEGGPVVDEDRYLEVWNLVFMQYERGAGEGHDYPILGDLPAKNIDTGLGVDRMAVVLQQVPNLYETDLLRPVLDLAAELTGTGYGASAADDVRLRVVADHARTVCLLVADGVVPSNEGAGYVLRRLLRRTVYTTRLLGAREPVLPALVARVCATVGPSYPELRRDEPRIAAVAAAEEDSFLATLRSGIGHFQRAVRAVRSAGEDRLPGEQAFALHDTYGFPVELTLEMAGQEGLTVDEDGFRRLMREQRERARRDAVERKRGTGEPAAYRELSASAGPSVFTGYHAVTGEGTVRGLLVDGRSVPAAAAGTEVEVLLDRTPFYPESGGQQADTGVLRTADAELDVTDVQRPVGELIVHRAVVRTGEARVGQSVHAAVDLARRRAVSRAHTATHLVHRAVRAALGEQAAQAGSWNAPGRFRFDFTSPAGLPPGLLDDVEDEVNRVLAEDLPVRAFVTSREEAGRLGAVALFGERYGERVRVVEVGEYARELCGGTHAERSAQVGMIKLLGESSIGSGVRRVEALVGLDAFRYLAGEHLLVDRLAQTLRSRPEELPDRVAELAARLRRVEKDLQRLRSGALLADAAGLAAGAQQVDGVALVTHRAPDGTDPDGLRRLALDVRGRLPADRPGVVAVGAVTDGRAAVVTAVNEAARHRGVDAAALARQAARMLGGGGGGRPDVGQGGGGRATALPAALTAVRDGLAGPVGPG